MTSAAMPMLSSQRPPMRDSRESAVSAAEAAADGADDAEGADAADGANGADGVDGASGAEGAEGAKGAGAGAGAGDGAGRGGATRGAAAPSARPLPSSSALTRARSVSTSARKARVRKNSVIELTIGASTSSANMNRATIKTSTSGHRLARARGELPHGAQVHFAGPERRNRVDEPQVFALRDPQPRQLRAAQ